MTEKRTGTFHKRILAAVTLLVICLAGCSPDTGSSPTIQSETEHVGGTDLKVHFIDVGQGDSTLVEKDGHFMLIDAGEQDQGEVVAAYLEKQGVRKLDYVIGTHPHSDHIGGLETIIRKFDVQKVFLPEKEHTTNVYEHMLDAIADKNLKITIPKPGDSYDFESASFRIIAPNKDYRDNLNNWSIGIRLVYGKTSFVLCGDVEKEGERDIVAAGFPLKADVLKLSHHGSSTSSSEEFIEQVDPEYGIIFCGKDNDYGHPHKEVVELLKQRNVKVFRTDRLGTIVAVSNGSGVSFPEVTEEDGEDRTQSTAADQDYVLNTNTNRFHRPDCQSATSMKAENREIFSGSREELIQMGYVPCQICNP